MNTIKFGAIKPEGWLKEGIIADMLGCIGNLDKLAPSLLVDHQIYGKDRLTTGSKQVELGRMMDEGEEDEAQFMWWNSESQSNWRDGYCRAALLLDDAELRAKVDEYIDYILSRQDSDGYLGIYTSELRFAHKGENGELWAQSTLFRVLLGYYEATADERVKIALLRAVDVVMNGYPMGKSNPFCVKDSFSGHGHGLTIVDTFNRLYTLTGDTKYLDYAVWLYENYSDNNVAEMDMQIGNIENPAYTWQNHGAHTYEHIRAVTIAAFHKPEKYAALLEKLLIKLNYYLAPSGGPSGDEWIFGRTADATSMGYEFCSVTELFDSYAMLLEKTTNLSWGDKMEWLYYNAGHGMKHPKESTIMYLKTDNCYAADCRRQQEDVVENQRYSYSPIHQKTAVCCVPNMGRLTPYFTKSMYIRTKYGFSAALFGPSVFRDQWDGADIEIRQITDYPATTKIIFEVSVSKPVTFTLGIRKPDWAASYSANCVLTEEDSQLKIEKQWMGTQQVSVEFDCNVVFKTDLKRDYYVTRGPLLYALPIDSTQETTLEFDLKPFKESVFRPVSRESENICIHVDSLQDFKHISSGNTDWKKQQVEGSFWGGEHFHTKTMVPIGGTILRKTTFKIGLGDAKAKFFNHPYI
jgi:DUF1680 family protein